MPYCLFSVFFSSLRFHLSFSPFYMGQPSFKISVFDKKKKSNFKPEERLPWYCFEILAFRDVELKRCNHSPDANGNDIVLDLYKRLKVCGQYRSMNRFIQAYSVNRFMTALKKNSGLQSVNIVDSPTYRAECGDLQPVETRLFSSSLSQHLQSSTSVDYPDLALFHLWLGSTSQHFSTLHTLFMNMLKNIAWMSKLGEKQIKTATFTGAELKEVSDVKKKKNLEAKTQADYVKTVVTMY